MVNTLMCEHVLNLNVAAKQDFIIVLILQHLGPIVTGKLRGSIIAMGRINLCVTIDTWSSGLQRIHILVV
jgi:hypothetical protein